MNTLADNKTVIALIASWFVGLLVMTGHLDPAHADEATQLTIVILGGVISSISLIGFIHHTTEVKKAQINADATASPVVTTDTANVQVNNAPTQ